MMGPWYGWGFGFGGWVMVIGMVIFWGLVIWGIVALIRWNGGRSSGEQVCQRSEPAIEILKSRYAKGEIGKEEFEDKKKTLT